MSVRIRSPFRRSPKSDAERAWSMCSPARGAIRSSASSAASRLLSPGSMIQIEPSSSPPARTARASLAISSSSAGISTAPGGGVDDLEVRVEGRRLDLLQGEGGDAAQLVDGLARQGGVAKDPPERVHDAGGAVGDRRGGVGERVEVPEPDPGDGIRGRTHDRCPGQCHQPRPVRVVGCDQDREAVADRGRPQLLHGKPRGP